MPVSAFPTNAEYFRVLPEIILTLFGTLIMFLEAVLSDDQKRILGPLSIVGLAAALWGAIASNSDPGPARYGCQTTGGQPNLPVVKRSTAL